MLVSFNENISQCSLQTFLTDRPTVFYSLNYKTRNTLLVQERVYKTKVRDVHELLEHIVDKWDKLDQRIIHKVVGVCRKRLRACVVVGAGHQSFSDCPRLRFCQMTDIVRVTNFYIVLCY